MITLGCGELGKVDQGRVIQFDKTKRTVTLIRDKKCRSPKPGLQLSAAHNLYPSHRSPGNGTGPEGRVKNETGYPEKGNCYF